MSSLVCLVLGACQPSQEQGAPPVVAKNKQAAPSQRQTVVAPPPAMDREALLLAVIRARSAAATAQEDTEHQAELDGQRFEFRIRLGCSFSSPDAQAALMATFDAEQRRVTVSATPDIGLNHPVASAAAGEAFEAAEGFWIPQPWVLTPACAAGDMPAGVGLIEYFAASDPRTIRRQGRPYTASETVPGDIGTPALGSWELILSGRLRKLGDGRVIHCHALEPAAIPTCLLSVQFNGVSIENVVSGERLAEWSAG
jgi:hypothetical protein